jgi:hypothetical protein
MKRGRNQRRRQGVNINRAYDSNGPEVRIRGTANQIYDKYLALARDASSSGDRVKGENYLQHAEHYFRVIRAMQASQQPQQQPDTGDNEGDQPTLGGASERERPGADAADYQDSEQEEAPVAAAGGRPANGHAESAEQGEAGRRPRRRRPRRGPRPEGEEPASDNEEPAEVAAG